MAGQFAILRAAAWKRRPLILAAEVAMIAAAGLGAFLLRFDFEIPVFYTRHLIVAIAAWEAAKLAAFSWHRLDTLALRFFSLRDLLQLCRANLLGSVMGAALIVFIAPHGFPRSIFILDLLLCVLFTSAGFVAERLLGEAMPGRGNGRGRATLIYGAGRAGVMLLSEIRQNAALRYSVCGFIDDDPRLLGVAAQGVRVLGAGHELAEIVAQLGVKEVLIAAPGATEDQTLRILAHCRDAHVRFRTVAGLGDRLEGGAGAPRIREVDVCDLLSREPVDLDHRLIREKIEGRVVMVTGAAGSIGSELCRQIAAFHPSAIVAFELAETPLFHLDQEMKALFPHVPLLREIGNIQNMRRLSEAIGAHRPSIIYHAAAYKHVPIMESDVIEAVFNNVCGTYNVIRAARDYRVEEFVLISSDKAVRPTSVMGATKRLCELLVLGMQNDVTRYVAVRFGNVLGSNGSVIPIFKQQILEGGPVTVTHPEMQRYFMTIPEAAQLVLQAAAMGRGGEIFVLDMGSQVKIVDIARKLILLSGLTPEVDIPIKFTGMRPGEKLYEELNLDDEENIPTMHRKIKSFIDGSPPNRRIFQRIEQLQHLCEARDRFAVMNLICELVPEYGPSEYALELAAPPRGSARAALHAPLAAAAKAAGS
jgi:FlaA1/EpsC-like NDP-sugar epimerase